MLSSEMKEFKPVSMRVQARPHDRLPLEMDLFKGKYVRVQFENEVQFGFLTDASRNKRTGTLFLTLEQIPGGSKVISIENAQELKINIVTSRDDGNLNFQASRRVLERLSDARMVIEPVQIKPRGNSTEVIRQLSRFIGRQVEVHDGNSLNAPTESGWLNSIDDIRNKGGSGNGLTLTLSHLARYPGDTDTKMYKKMLHSENYYPHGMTVKLAD